MNFDEWKKLVKGMKSIWTREDFLPDGYSVKVWYELLKDIPYNELNMAVQLHAARSKWPPSIAELREGATTSALTTDWSEGWGKVLTAIGSYGMYQEGKALESMDEHTALTVKRLGWKQICQANQDEMASIRANFRMIYEQVSTKAKTEAVLPERLKTQLEAKNTALLEDKMKGLFT